MPHREFNDSKRKLKKSVFLNIQDMFSSPIFFSQGIIFNVFMHADL